MESLRRKITEPGEFLYSSSLALKIIYEAFVKKKISQEEKLKLKDFLLNKNELIEVIKKQYKENPNNFVDWSFIRKKLKESSEKFRKVTINFKIKNIKELKNPRRLTEDTDHYQAKKYKYPGDSGAKSGDYNAKKNNNYYCDLNKREDRSTVSNNNKNKNIKNNKCYSSNINNEQSLNEEFRFKLIAESTLQKETKNGDFKFSNYSKKDSLLYNIYRKKESNVPNSYLRKSIHSKIRHNLPKKYGTNKSNSKDKIDFYDKVSDSDDSLNIEFNSDSIIFNKGEDSLCFISDEEEIRNLSTTAGLENAFLDSISNTNKNISNNNSIDTNNIINLSSTPTNKNSDYPSNFKFKKVSLFRTESK